MIKPNFTIKEFSNLLKERVRKIEDAILTNLKFIGETFIVNARSEDTYKDQTGNLRSSIGYIIYKDGKRVYTGFPGSKDTGRFKGIQVAEDVAKKFPKGYLLVVVAGMEYAAKLESKGYNVLTTQSFKAEADIIKMIQRIKNKIPK